MRKIFIASSTEAIEKAEDVRKVISGHGGVEASLWKEFFEPGFLTFQSLESMLNQCCAAVFIASADDKIIVRDKSVMSPSTTGS